MKWNIGSSSIASSSTATLPPDHPRIPSTSATLPPAGCPMHNSSPSIAPVQPTPPVSGPSSKGSKGAQCPIPHDQRALHPLNAIPLGLSATEKSPGQVMDLPTDREVSTIPRPQVGDESDDEHAGKWEYPSPQQFYNALVRKGWETPEESIEMVVAIHNFLNERAWEEVMKWEKRLPGGEYAQLARFQGRPGELSPKARMHLWAGKIFPSRFNTEPPFDRHDWIVTRPTGEFAAPSASTSTSTSTQTSTNGLSTTTTTSSESQTPTSAPYSHTSTTHSESPESSTTTKTTRYVIDYYSAPADEDGNPVFSLDVRPALDSFESISERIKVSVEEFMRGNRDE